MNYIDYLKYFEHIFDFPIEAREKLAQSLLAIISHPKASDQLDALIVSYDNSYNIDYERNNRLINDIAELTNVEKETALLLIYILMSKKLKEYYVAKGYDEEMWFEAMSDLKDRLNECFTIKRIWGSNTDWFVRFFNFNLFAFGRLQFNYSNLYADYNGEKVKLKKGDKIIGVHIPGGRPLERNAVIESLNRAKEFFKKDFSKVVPLVCKTYLFHSSMVELYKPTSNLLWFYSLFDVYYQEETDHILDAWRVFNCEVKDLNLLPEKTSLQKGLKKHLLNGGKMGIGVGIILK